MPPPPSQRPPCPKCSWERRRCTHTVIFQRNQRVQRDQRNQSKAQSSRLVKYSADKSAYIGPSWLGPVGEYVEAPHSVQDLTSSRADEGQL
eukprot:SAG25_NODE_3247_length_1160_cov_0.688973_2_plen_90_part_01